MSSNSTLKES